MTVTDLQKTLIRQLGHWNFVEKHSAYVFPQVSTVKSYIVFSENLLELAHKNDENEYSLCIFRSSSLCLRLIDVWTHFTVAETMQYMSSATIP